MIQSLKQYKKYKQSPIFVSAYGVVDNTDKGFVKKHVRKQKNAWE